MHPRAEESRQRAREGYRFDPDVKEFPEGTPTAVFPIDPDELWESTGAEPVALAE